MAISQQNHRLLAIIVLFTVLAILLLAVLWFEGSQLLNGLWHAIHGFATADTLDGFSRHP